MRQICPQERKIRQFDVAQRNSERQCRHIAAISQQFHNTKYDKDKSRRGKNSVFQVPHSIQGNRPAEGTDQAERNSDSKRLNHMDSYRRNLNLTQLKCLQKGKDDYNTERIAYSRLQRKYSLSLLLHLNLPDQWNNNGRGCCTNHSRQH